MLPIGETGQVVQRDLSVLLFDTCVYFYKDLDKNFS